MSRQSDYATVGLIEDDPVMGGSIVQRLELEGCSVRWWKTGADALQAVDEIGAATDLIVCDIRLPDMSGEDVFRRFANIAQTPPFLFITSFGDIDQAVRLMRLGAVDFMTKPFSMDDFLKRINAGRRSRQGPDSGPHVLGVSAAMRQIEDLLRRYARHDMPVLITGETGAGKEIAARFLHQMSEQGGGPFIAVNCAAIPAELLESELFGHEKGAFTGATQRHLGYAERAATGTLFLDEIGDMPLALQVKLLRLIEDRAFNRLGGETPVPFRARIVAATHQEIGAKQAGATFREDLYFRLAVLPVEIPPLRARPEDVSWLMDRLLADAAERQHVAVRGYSALAEEAALAYQWPGNVRELRNRVERAVAIARGEWIMPGDLFPDHPEAASTQSFTPLAHARDAAERRQIARALEATGGQVSKAAKLLSISRTTLWEKMNRLGLTDRERSGS